MKKKIIILLIILLIVIGIFFVYKYLSVQKENKVEHDKLKDNADIVDTVIDKGIIKSLTEKEQEPDYLKISKDILDELNKKHDTDKIIAYLDTGENGIREIIAHDPDSDFYDRRDIHGNYDHSGTVFLYKENTSPLDPYTTYFGHNMHNGTRLFKLTDYTKYKDVLQKATLYTYEGILEYELVSIANPNDTWYDKTITWEKNGVEDYFSELATNANIIERTENYEEDAHYMFLSTCFDADGRSKVIAVYKLVEHNKK